MQVTCDKVIVNSAAPEASCQCVNYQCRKIFRETSLLIQEREWKHRERERMKTDRNKIQQKYFNIASERVLYAAAAAAAASTDGRAMPHSQFVYKAAVSVLSQRGPSAGRDRPGRSPPPPQQTHWKHMKVSLLPLWSDSSCCPFS